MNAIYLYITVTEMLHVQIQLVLSNVVVKLDTKVSKKVFVFLFAIYSQIKVLEYKQRVKNTLLHNVCNTSACNTKVVEEG